MHACSDLSQDSRRLPAEDRQQVQVTIINSEKLRYELGEAGTRIDASQEIVLDYKLYYIHVMRPSRDIQTAMVDELYQRSDDLSHADETDC